MNVRALARQWQWVLQRIKKHRKLDQYVLAKIVHAVQYTQCIHEL